MQQLDGVPIVDCASAPHSLVMALPMVYAERLGFGLQEITLQAAVGRWSVVAIRARRLNGEDLLSFAIGKVVPE